jgi:tetratricopeptide (TPR) repeat protein
MTKQNILVAIAACLAGFIGGFMLANTLNRREMASMAVPQPTIEGQQTTQDQSRGPVTLTPEEIKSRVAAADQNPTDFSKQRNLGIALYQYASFKKDATILPDAIRLLQRALDLDPENRDLQIALGNAHFDLGYFNKDNQALERSRDYYQKALSRIPNDTDVRADLALTYYLQEPPDLDTTIKEFEKGLESNPKHERSLQFVTQTYVKKNEIAKANETLDRLKAANPSNPAIAELTGMIAGGPESVK